MDRVSTWWAEMVRTNFAVGLGRRGETAASTEATLAEHAVVRLSAPTELGDGRRLPIGARGAIVVVHGGGMACEVEFIAPFHVVATVSAADLSSADDA